jgi:hypothetical protein
VFDHGRCLGAPVARRDLGCTSISRPRTRTALWAAPWGDFDKNNCRAAIDRFAHAPRPRVKESSPAFSICVPSGGKSACGLWSGPTLSISLPPQIKYAANQRQKFILQCDTGFRCRSINRYPASGGVTGSAAWKSQRRRSMVGRLCDGPVVARCRQPQSMGRRMAQAVSRPGGGRAGGSEGRPDQDLSPLNGVGLHKLKGDGAGQWAMTVNACLSALLQEG